MINLCKKQQGLSTQTVILDTSRLVTHGALGLKKVGSNKGHDSLNVQYSCVFVGCHLRRKVVEFAVFHETHNLTLLRIPKSSLEFLIELLQIGRPAQQCTGRSLVKVGGTYVARAIGQYRTKPLKCWGKA